MLPFVFLDESKLGPFHPFGICCAVGLLAWDYVVMRQVRRKGMDAKDFRVLTLWVLGMGTIFSMSVDAIFYHPPGHSIASSLLSMQGFSTTGGFVGGAVAAVIWRHLWIGREDGRLRMRRRETPMALLGATEIFISTWPVAWALGRLGCALIHDHPGITVPHGTLGSLFAVAWPRGPEDGIDHVLGPLHVVTGGSDARFDLGLLEFFLISVMGIAFATTWKRELRPGTCTIIGTLTYGTMRFFFDFLRMHDGPAGELRHGGLTFAQYWSLAIIAFGLTVLVRRLRAQRAVPAAT